MMFSLMKTVNALAYTSEPYVEAMSMHPDVTYTPYVHDCDEDRSHEVYS